MHNSLITTGQTLAGSHTVTPTHVQKPARRIHHGPGSRSIQIYGGKHAAIMPAAGRLAGFRANTCRAIAGADSKSARSSAELFIDDISSSSPPPEGPGGTSQLRSELAALNQQVRNSAASSLHGGYLEMVALHDAWLTNARFKVPAE